MVVRRPGAVSNPLPTDNPAADPDSQAAADDSYSPPAGVADHITEAAAKAGAVPPR